MRYMVVMLAGLSVGLSIGGCGEPRGEKVGQAERAAWTPLPTTSDPLVRMPGSQPGSVNLEDSQKCVSCHGGYNTAVEPLFNWQGSMMAQAGRDPIFYAAFTVAAQDSIWALGNPNAADLCERCHFPAGWLAGRSDPPNASAMTGGDFDGVSCDLCHRMIDPHFETTAAGTREGSDWLGYWDETGQSQTPSAAAAAATLAVDRQVSSIFDRFDGVAFYSSYLPPAGYGEASSGQYFIAPSADKRASFADAGAKHGKAYSRFHKSKFMCAACHDVSNPALLNLPHKGTAPGGGGGPLPSETQAAHAYFHVERTFSEFMLSAYGKPGGAPGSGAFAPTVFKTSRPGNNIATCQDCHMRDVSGVGCDKKSGVDRPSNSVEHPKSGQPLHDLTGGNVLVTRLLASTVPGSPGYDATNATLLGAAGLTVSLGAGLGLDAAALNAGAARAEQQLALAASIEALTYDPASGKVDLRVVNHTGHKLPSGFPEGRRAFLNIRAYAAGALIGEVNPYDATVGTLRGLPASYSPQSPALGPNESYDERLVYEMHPTSTLTGEQKTFHFVLATGRYKDNRIPPRGFDIGNAPTRLADPVWNGASAPTLYTTQEYAGGYDAVSATLPVGADQIVARLYYQTTSREYVAFLRDEIKGTASTLPAGAYVVQVDPFFANLKGWGDTIWQLWQHNKSLPGAAPVLMAEATINSTGGCTAPTPSLASASAGTDQVTLTWSDEHSATPAVSGYRVYYDQAGKRQLVLQVGTQTSYVDGSVTGGQQYCYVVTSVTAGCESAPSNVRCATPQKGLGKSCSVAGDCGSGYCVDDVCCDSACGGGDTGDCQACAALAGASSDGSCELLGAQTVCRAVSGDCDVEERCSGAATSCPADGHASDGTPCPGGSCQGGSCVALTPDQGVPDQGVPDQGVPDQGVPDQAVPDQAVPDQAVPDQAVPDQAVPDQAVPDQAVPDQGTPTPDQGTPTPDQGTPTPDQGTPTPDQGVPDQGVPDQGVPDQGAPDSGPDQSSPDLGPDQGASDDARPADASTDAASDLSSDRGVTEAGVDLAAGDTIVAAGDRPAGTDGPGPSSGCGCRTSGAGSVGWPWIVLLALVVLRRRRRREAGRR